MSYPSFMRKSLIAGIAVFIFCLGGCGSSPPSRFYTLTSLTFPEEVEEVRKEHSSFAVRIGPVRIPDYLDRAQIVTRTPWNDLLLGEFDLWGGSLKADAERVLVENVSLLLRGEGIFVTGWKNRVPGAMNIPVVLNRFDVVPGNTATLSAQWGIAGKEGKGAEILRESKVVKPVMGRDYGSIVAAMSDTLGELSKEMAHTIRSVRGGEHSEKDQ